MSESHHEYMMRTSQPYRDFIEERNRELFESIPILEPGQRRIRELEEQLRRAEQAQCEKARLRLELKRETSEGAELERRLHIAYASRQELRQKNKEQRAKIAELTADLERLCKITQWAEPNTEAMKRILGDKQECFAYGCTIRACIDCGTPVYGGPTRCSYCVGKLVGAEKAEARIAELTAILEQIANREGHYFYADISEPDEKGMCTVIGPGKPELTKQCAHWMRSIARKALRGSNETTPQKVGEQP